MEITLNSTEVRVLGCLIEKELITPDGYPLSLVALTAACNQKSSREPVMNLNEATVLDSVNTLMKKHLLRERGGASSRVSKYAHRLSGHVDPADDFSQRERAILGLLMLRGPQTLGELRTRSGRMYDFQDLEEVEATLLDLATRKDGPFTAEIPRQPGQRERRFMHLLSGDKIPEHVAASDDKPFGDETSERVTALEDEVSLLKNELRELRDHLVQLLSRCEGESNKTDA